MEVDWVVDGLVGFLRSSMWKLMVDNFMEQNCIVFEQGDTINQPIYRAVHLEYQEMVDKLLNHFTLDLEITPEQLADACVKSKNLRAEHEVLFQPLLASEDFEIFKSIMLHKNIELEKQALMLLQRQSGQFPDLYQPGTKDNSSTEQIIAEREKNEERILLEVLEQSRKEYNMQVAMDKGEMERMLSLAMEESLRLAEDSKSSEEFKNSDDSKSSEEELPESSESLANKSSESSVQSNIGLVPLDLGVCSKKDISSEDAAQLWLQSAKSDAESRQLPLVKQKISLSAKLPNDLKTREIYLKKQRNRLLEKKKKINAAELKSYKATLTFHQQFPSQTEKGLAMPVSSSSDEDTKKGSDEVITAAGAKPQSLKSRTGVLCSVIARKLKKEETDL